MACPPESSPAITLQLGAGLGDTLQERCQRTLETAAHLIREVLAEALDPGHHTIDQMSTSSALVGFWTPRPAPTINVPRYQLQLLSDARRDAGPVLELQSRALSLELHRESPLQLVLLERPEFHRADLSGDPVAALARAEGKHA
jgi:alpha-acetolactate decarboxylase